MPSRRIARARQPQTLVPINRANKFGARTQFFSSDLGQLIDAVTGRIPTISGVVPAMDFAGVVREIDTAGASPHYVEWPSAGVDLSGPFTIAIKIRRLVASSSQYDRIFHSEGTTGGGSRFGFLFTGSGDGNGPDKVYFDFVDSVGGSGAVYPPVTPTSSTTNYETYVATHDGANVRIYLNGVLQGSVAFTTFAAAQLPNPIRYGADTFAGGATNNGAPARIQFAHIMRGALTAAEVFAYSANPWQIFTPQVRRRVLNAAAGGGSTGTLAKTNANDTSAAAGTTTVLGTLAKTNANDTSAASGTTTVTGTLAKTNANDTVVASGSTGQATGTLARTNANDTSAAAGTTTVIGTLAKTNANDSVVASGVAGIVSGTLAYTNNNDTVVASGTTPGPVSSNNGAGGGAQHKRSFGRAFAVDTVKPLEAELRKWKKLKDKELGITEKPKETKKLAVKTEPVDVEQIEESLAAEIVRKVAAYEAVADEIAAKVRNGLEVSTALQMRREEEELLIMLLAQEL